jgi:DNA polymerase elongation subunit (family B)
MQSGKTSFKNMAFSELRRLQFDLETTSLSHRDGVIFMIAIRDSTGYERLLEGDEATLIRDLVATIEEQDPDVIENHNLFGFDLPFLEARAKVHGIPLAIGRPPAPRIARRVASGWRKRYSVGGRELLDTLDATWRMDFVTRALKGHGLKEVAKHYGLASADREYISGRDVHKTYVENPERVRRYALDDVREVDAISDRLHRSSFALAQMVPRRLGRVASAGTATGILEPLLIRAYLREEHSMPNGGPVVANPHEGGAVRLFAAGLAKRVVKADVASLYPSLIRTYKIGPRSDALGVFVHVVDRLTTLRLKHKALANAEGGEDRATHEGTQAALKLIINSAYGYLGAGQLARFADREAADEITARGRALLQTICDRLEAEGVTLIEADTDGVYVSVPAGWSREDESSLVEKVGNTLPDGMDLDFDGSFAAMYSHEIKNYALLSHDGVLTVRGAAFRSSRLEPFAQAWLSHTLELLLVGNIPAIRDAYLAQRQAIRDRELGLSDVLSLEKLTKTPAEYSASTRLEPKYEAMRLAGRTAWSAGDRVGLYRAQDQTWRLADAPQAESAPYNAAHYLDVLDKMAQRFSKAFSEADFAAIFRPPEQPALFDPPLENIRARLQPVVH